MRLFGRKKNKEEDLNAEELVDASLLEAQNKVNEEESFIQDEKDLMELFDDCSDVELLLMGEEAHNSTMEEINKLLESNDFFDNLPSCLSALHAYYIYKKVVAERKIEDKTLSELQQEYNELQKKWEMQR